MIPVEIKYLQEQEQEQEQQQQQTQHILFLCQNIILTIPFKNGKLVRHFLGGAMEQFFPPCFRFSSLGVNRNDTEKTHFWVEGLVCLKRSMYILNIYTLDLKRVPFCLDTRLGESVHFST